MSGICGLLFNDRNGKVAASALAPMVQALDVTRHDQGEGKTACVGSLGIGARAFHGQRAGIAQRSVQGQPCALAFCGSLYNLGDLRATESRTDDVIERLLLRYIEEGIAFLQHLRGEFSFALWDGRNYLLHLATDRFRVQPLFYYHDTTKLVFASRLQALLACPFSIPTTIEPEAIADVIVCSAIPTPKTIFREVKKLQPGHTLTYSKDQVSVSPYWEVNFLQPSPLGEAELAQRVKATFADAVAVRLKEDAPTTRVGTFLSGGIDSSTVTGVLTQLAGQPVKSFSIGFAEQHFNEINYARIAARAFGAEHHEYFVTSQDTYDAIPILLGSFDEPFANASAVPTYFCAKIAREHDVTILYAGDGGDELFAGNDRYATQQLFQYYSQIPLWLRSFVLKPLTFAFAEYLRWNIFVKGKKYIERASIPYPQRLSTYGLLEILPMAELFESDFLHTVGSDYNPHAPMNAYYFQAPAKSELDRQLYIDLKLVISDNDLLKVTRMTEAAGVAVRFPFLDHVLAEFAASIPARMKMPGRQLRSFFKNTYADLLPLEVRTKTKHGFGLPIPVWLRTDRQLNDLMRELVLSPKTVQRGYFRKKSLEALVDRHATDPTSFYGTILWHVMVLELWHRKYEENGYK